MANKPIKNECRQGLIPYLHLALDQVVSAGDLLMLDAGCGSGIPTLALARRFDGHIHALDPDAAALESLRQSFATQGWQHRLTIQLKTLEKNHFPPAGFDLILAEGLLNVTGFANGFDILGFWLKPGGYCILHDELKDHEEKVKFMESMNYTVVYTNILDEHIWWNDYCSCLEQQLKHTSNPGLYPDELHELQLYRQNPALFRSVYYVVRKNI